MFSSKTLPRAWLTVALLCVVGCLNYLVRIMITTMRGPIVESMPMTDAQFGLLTSAFLWAYAISSPIAGFIADRFKRNIVIIVCLFAWSLVTWGTAYATSFEELLFTRILMGMSEACYIPAALALISDYHPGPTRSFATGLHMAGIMAGQGLSFLGSSMAETHDWGFSFQVFGVIGIAYAVLLLPLLREAPLNRENPTAEMAPSESIRFSDAIAHLVKNKFYLMVLIYWGILGLSWVVIGWLPTFYAEKFNLQQSTASLYATAYLNTATFIGVLTGGALADYFSRSNIRGRILVPFFGLCIAAPAIFMAGSTSVLPIAIIGFMTYAFMLTFNDSNMMPILGMVLDPRYRATGYGILNMLSCMVGGAGVYISGLLLDAEVNFDTIFQLVALIIGGNAILLFFIKPKSQTTNA